MKKRTLALMLSAALCVGLLAGCGSGNNDPVNTPAAGGSETPSQESTAALSGTVNTNGSTSMESVMGYLTEGFKEVQPGITVNYTGSGSSAGVTGAQDGTCDIGLASRDLKDDETGVKAITVAKDGIAIIVNPAQPRGRPRAWKADRPALPPARSPTGPTWRRRTARVVIGRRPAPAPATASSPSPAPRTPASTRMS
ncbi:MAG: substrate-binding domain-containing protein [Flavonifractor plautii]